MASNKEEGNGIEDMETEMSPDPDDQEEYTAIPSPNLVQHPTSPKAGSEELEEGEEGEGELEVEVEREGEEEGEEEGEGEGERGRGDQEVDELLLPSPPTQVGQEEEEEGEEEGEGEGEGEEGDPQDNGSRRHHHQQSPPPLPPTATGLTEQQQQQEQDERDPCRSEGELFFSLDINHLVDRALSEPVYIRNLPWRILVMLRDSSSADKTKSIGVYVQCSPESPESPRGWSVSGRATITAHHCIDPKKSFSRDVSHWFCAKENDWGYSNFLAWKDLVDPEKGFTKDGIIMLSAYVTADAPHGINWDSRRYTGYVGLKNQGATCYMNSLLQTLYCTNKLRKAVYQMPTENDDSSKSVALALQRIFNELQHNEKAVGTKKLTKAFGWDTMDIFMQHDVQELCRVLLDNMDSKMKGTVVEGTIPRLFEGKMESYVRCTNVDYESTRVETFFDLQLNIKGKKDVYESFKDYVSVELLEGDNKYDAGNHGLQEAKKGVIFLSFPPILHLQLMRFQYDPLTESNIKINDRYEFPEKLRLDDYLKEPEPTPAHYTLHAVLVHSGDNYGGHYVAYLNPKGTGNWLKFDDDVVSTCSKKDATENNFGGNDDTISIRNCTNAYMLVYIRDSCIGDVLVKVTDEDISESLTRRFAEEKRVELAKRKERSEAHLYLTVSVYTEDDFSQHQGIDLVDFDNVKRNFQVLKSYSLCQFHQFLAHEMGYPPSHIRIWPFERRKNNTTRPSYLEDRDKATSTTVYQFAMLDLRQGPWKIFVEMLPPDSDLEELPHYDFTSMALLFYKYYDPARSSMLYAGHSVESLDIRISDLYKRIREFACLNHSVPLRVYEEVKPTMLDQVNPSLTLTQLSEVRDGDIFCFQRTDLPLVKYELPSPVEYFRDIYYRIEVTFYDKSLHGHDSGVTATLNQKMNYHQMAQIVAQHLNTSPYLLQFFRPQLPHHRNFSDQPIRCSNEGNLRDFLYYRHHIDGPLVLYYQRLSIPIEEFEKKKLFKCLFVSQKLREEKEFTVYVDKNGTVKDLLLEACKEIPFSEKSSRQLRLLEVMTHRIVDIHSPERPVNELFPQKSYRIEEVRQDELHLKPNEALIPVAHFSKNPCNLFGVPFLLRIADGEHLSSVKSRIQTLLDVPEKDFDKWKFAIVQTIQPTVHLNEENDEQLFLHQFLLKTAQFPRLGSPWLGLDHFNKNPKRIRYMPERAIKIHN